MTLKEAEDLDKILTYSLKVKHRVPLSIENLIEEVLPNENLEYANILFCILNNFDRKILNPLNSVVKNNCFWANEKALVLLNDGGFTKLYYDHEKDAINERVLHDTNKASLDKTKWDLKFRYGTLGFSIISVIATVLSGWGAFVSIKESLKSKENKQILELKIDSLDKKLKQIERYNLNFPLLTPKNNHQSKDSLGAK
jgi:hypothetical protein